MIADPKTPDDDNAIEEVLVDPDAPERGDTKRPQTVDAEPDRARS